MAKISKSKLSCKIFKINFSTPHHEYELYKKRFDNSELGRIYKAIPWLQLIALFRKMRREPRGSKAIFDMPAKLGLMFLKSYTGCSDKKLMERLSTDYTLQFFCNVYFRPDEEIPNFKIISDIRVELANQLNISEMQDVLAKAWAPYLKDRHVCLSDATAYETSMRFPTDVKLLWECCEWVNEQMKNMRKCWRTKLPRSKHKEQKNKYLSYQKNRKKTFKKTRKRIKSLLYLLNKELTQISKVAATLPQKAHMPKRYNKRLSVIRKIYKQQKQLFETGVSPKGRIVSIDKDYIRPIVRGKEIKRVEFGAKVNMIQADGINFIEHLDFNAFHEGNRLQNSVRLHKELFGKCSHVGMDGIYATNANRKYCKSKNITTNFVRKGKAGQYEEQTKHMRNILSKQRATQMEGSFGTEKESYGLYRIKARTKKTETLWIVFGIHTANAVRITKKMEEKEIQIHKLAA